jgi:23S rRNA pseudouridine2605 synthase
LRPNFSTRMKQQRGRGNGGPRKPGRSSQQRSERPERQGKPTSQRDGQRSGGKKSYGKDYKAFKRVKRKGAEELAANPKDGMRLNRYLAIAGIASRREADELIKAGLVTVNGEVVTEMGIKVKPTDDVRYGGTRIKAEKKVYIVMNKPKGFITTVSDPKARKTVMDLFAGKINERIYPVGRLDRATTGVLMFTNDGELAKKLTHPGHGAKKIYQVTLDKALKPSDLDDIVRGVELDDGPVPVDSLSYIAGKAKTQVGIELHVGRNRIVRRLFEHMGYEVIKLDRVSFAGLTKKNLSRGQWRHLTHQELNYLQMVK